MLVVQLQHLVIQQLEEINLQGCPWEPVCILDEQCNGYK